MSDDRPKHEDTPGNQADAPDLYDLTPEDAEPTLEGDAESGELVDERFAALQAERDELEAKLLRTAADYQNYVRRSQQNLDAARQETLMRVARELVPVLDNFDRALELKAEAVSSVDVQKGVESIRSSLLQALEGFGMKRLDVEVGHEFDPHVHEALMRQPSETVESNHIAMVLLPGYMLKEQPVRPAQVSVAE